MLSGDDHSTLLWSFTSYVLDRFMGCQSAELCGIMLRLYFTTSLHSMAVYFITAHFIALHIAFYKAACLLSPLSLHFLLLLSFNFSALHLQYFIDFPAIALLPLFSYIFLHPVACSATKLSVFKLTLVELS